uniref:Gbf-1 n=1 Tax=Pristionchus pacificus TaxID=54126 RepID=A0A2A6CEE9_PRIPA|eukprot:PDM76458.1 gbf-1 [Pristionchus pacificus]
MTFLQLSAPASSSVRRAAAAARMASFASDISTWRFWWKTAKVTALGYCVASTISNHLGELVICSGPSMHPTIEDGDLVIAERLSIKQRTLRKGDIVGCLNPHDHKQLLCKRLAGMQRDIVEPTEALPTGRVPTGHVFLRGDNEACSTDSRHFGPVPQGNSVELEIRSDRGPTGAASVAAVSGWLALQSLVLRARKEGGVLASGNPALTAARSARVSGNQSKMAVNGLHVVLGESDAVVALLKKARRHWHLQNNGSASLEDTDPLLRSFADLRDVLNKVSDVMDMNPLTFLSPFLEVIRSQNTNGPITESALSSVAKFLSYGLIDASSVKAAHTVESIAQAVTHTKFIGGANAGSDECVLFEILHVLRALLLSPAGRLLSNEAVCDMMQSCFRICFELHLSELLRKAARTTLADMTQLIFTRLPTFEEDLRHPYIRKLVMNTKGQRRRRKTRPSEKKVKKEVKEEEEERERERSDSEKEAEDVEVVEAAKETDVLVEGSTASSADTVDEEREKSTVEKKKAEDIKTITSDSEGECAAAATGVGGVDLAAGLSRGGGGGEGSESSERVNALLLPYGLPCCRELLRFLIALTDPLDRQNTEQMIVLGLSLLTVALEAAADHLSSYVLLLPLIKNELCRSLLQLLDTEKLPIFAAASRCCFLLMESMRAQLKFQLEALFGKLKGIVLSEQSRISYEQKEMALESIVQLWRIPGLVTELYLNFDCDLYAGNVFEDMTKLLAENAFPVSGLRSTSLLSLDALLVVIDTIDMNCHCRRAGAIVESADESSRALAAPALSGYDIGKRIVRGGEHTQAVSEPATAQLQHSSPALRVNRHAPSPSLPPLSEVIERKKRKKLLNEATDIFNKNPKKGIDFLRERGLLEGAGTTASIVEWLRANPRLDKAMIADYICNRKHADVLEAFVKAFPFENTRLDVALRLFLETFRLPGEAPLISMVMQHFSEAWFKANDEPFNHVDAAFTLSYAVIMLNTDQHNPTARRNQPSMTVECFRRNLSGTNGGQDFDPDMLEQVYNAIKTEEIVMPAEQTGLVKENYLWKVLLRRGETSEGTFTHAPTGWNDQDLFALIWGPAIAALSYVFDKSEHEHILQRALSGYRQCASIAADYGMSDVFDNLAIHLCKFSTLMTAAERAGDDSVELQRQRAIAAAAAGNDGVAANAPEMVACAFGENTKAHMATRTMFELVLAHGDILREGWKNVLDCLLHLFTLRLLPTEFTECEDFVDEKGWVSIVRVHSKSLSPSRSEGGLLSWFGIGGAADAAAARQLTPEQERLVKIATSVVSECRPWSLIVDSKYLTSSALNELLNALTHASGAVVAKADAEAEQKGHRAAKLSEEDEDAVIFYLELIVAICIENKDRLGNVWSLVRRHVEWLLSPRFGRSHVVVERAAVGLLRVANRYLYRENDPLADEVLQSLGILLQLPAAASFVLSRQISYGLHELLRRNAANVHRKEQWSVIFALLQATGAALTSDEVEEAREAREQAEGGGATERNAFSDTERGSSVRTMGTDRGYTSDDPSARHFGSTTSLASSSTSTAPRDSAISLPKAASQEWIHLSHKDAAGATAEALRALGGSAAAYARHESLVLRTALGRHEPAAYLKVAETLEFLLRDAAHITPENVDSAVECLLTMVEAGLNGGEKAAGPLSGRAQQSLRSNVHAEGGGEGQRRAKTARGKKELSTEVEREVEKAKEEEKELSFRYDQVSYQLMTACQTIFKRTPAMYREWAESGHGDVASSSSIPSMFRRVWCPLLRAIARSCADCRKNVRDRAADLLDRTFLLTELNEGLGAAEWEACFEQVLFPLLSQLLTKFSPMDPFGVEQTRTRVLKTVVRITLNHRSLLTEQCAFVPLWLRLLSFMERYANERSGQDSLADTVEETLKNMLFVLHSEGKFGAISGLYEATVARMQTAFPQLAEVLPAMQPQEAAAPAAETAAEAAPPPAATAQQQHHEETPPVELPELEEVVHYPYYNVQQMQHQSPQQHPAAAAAMPTARPQQQPPAHQHTHTHEGP